ncbi:heavy metal-associated isoprenylated plant protein 3-like isoform X3 [Rhododendron vialii]|uniref:heavy metal-associated isoprenylated plant protein 3-like isoform X3 n=1 Tax=Rhododendron vialii TaxID=182163 RepID=UPI00265F277E|nr:heavy metal-associated isoprenylated plant protein 3-like isoform X3 [Rhododendron vialii]
MGEKDDAAKGGAEEKKPAAAPAAGGGEKKDDGPTTVVLKFDMHCEGCAKKIKRAVRHLDDVDDVKADIASNKLTVVGKKLDPAKVKGKVEEKTKNKVEIVSVHPKKEAAPAPAAGGGDKKAADEKPEKKPDEKPKEPPVSTVVLKIRLHCDGCMLKIKRIISKIKGVTNVAIDAGKDLVTVIGTMDTKELAPYLKERLRRSVEVVPPPKKAEGGGEKKDKEGGGDQKPKEGGGGGDKKEGGGGGDKKEGGEAKAASGDGGGKKSEEPKVEVNKLEYYGSPYTSSYYTMPNHNQGYIDQGYGPPIYNHYNQGYASSSYGQGYANPGYDQGYPNHGYIVEYSHPPPPPPSYYMPAPQTFSDQHQMFSDENPNACSTM